jgi:hypothetical protein
LGAARLMGFSRRVVQAVVGASGLSELRLSYLKSQNQEIFNAAV